MRVPSGTARKFPTQKPSIDKVAEHIADVVTVAESIDSGQFDKVSIPEVSTVAGIHKQVIQVAEVEQYVRMLALDLGNIAEVASELEGVLNVSNNMATVLLLHSRMADLLNIQKSLVHIDAVALNEANINGVYKAIPDITTLVSHMDKLVRIADMEPQLNAVFQNLNGILELGSNVEHIVNVSTHIDAVVKASSFVHELEELLSTIQAVEDNLRVISADTYAQAEAASDSATEAFESADQARASAEIASMGATSASASWDKVRAAEEIVVAGVATTNANAISTATDAEFISNKVADAKAYSDAALSSKTAAANSAESVKAVESTVSMYADKASVSEAAAKASEIAATTSENNAKVEANRAKMEADSAIATEQRIQQAAAGQLDSIATEGAKQIALAKSHADKAALSEQASSESAIRSESAAQRAEDLVEQATGGALLKEQNLADVPNKEAARTHLDVPSKSQLAQAISEAIGAVTPASIGARPDSWTPTAADVGALPVNANAVSATKLLTARTINGTNFDGTANITTANWGTARTLTIGSSGKSVNGGADVAWSLDEIGAAPGGFGIGEGSRQKDPNTLHVGGLWRDTVSGLAGITLPYDSTPSSRAIGVTVSGGLRTAVRTSDAAYVWKKIYSEADKPTSADVSLGNVNNWEASSAVNLASDTTYATAGAVKKAYDLAAAAMPKTGGIFSAGITVNGSIFSDSGVIRSKAAGNTSGGIHIGGGNGYAEIAPMLNADTTPVWAQSLRYYGPDDWRIGVTSRIFHQNYLPTAAQVGARPDNWMPTAADVGAVAKAGDTMTGILAITDRDSAGAFGVKRLSASQFANYGQSGDSGGEVLLGVGPTVEDFSAYLKVGVDKLTFQNGSSTEKKVYHEGFKPTAADVGARPSNWLPSLEEIGAASTGSVDALQTAGSASFVYAGGALTQMTEQLPSGTRVTAYSYTEGQLTKAVETFGQLARTTTYTYLAGILTGFTTTEGGV